jgi:ribosomal protein L29
MPRNTLTKEEIKVKVLNLKNSLYNEKCSQDTKEVAEKYLNDILFIIEQYSR